MVTGYGVLAGLQSFHWAHCNTFVCFWDYLLSFFVKIGKKNRKKMVANFLGVVVTMLCLLQSTSGLTCSSLSVDQPCYEVHNCDVSKLPTLIIEQLSSGAAHGKSTAEATLCYNDNGVSLRVTANQQMFYPKQNAFDSCNDAVFNADVVEFFMTSPAVSVDGGIPENNLHCYNELDVNPANAIFESGIVNPNLNHTGVQNVLIPCGTSGISHLTAVDGNSWKMSMDVPYSVLDHPAGCPSKSLVSEASMKSKVGRVYRGNLYRINELTGTTTCSSSLCEYLAWSATGCTPPAFHEPTKFGYFIFV